VGLLVVAVALVSSFQAPEYNFEFQKTVYPEKLFVQGQNHLKKVGVKRIFVPHRWGGALLYHFDGKYLNFIDSRNDCFSREVWNDYFTIINTRSKWFDTWNKYDPQAAFLPNSTPLTRKLQAQNWQVKAQNKQGILLLKPQVSKKK